MLVSLVVDFDPSTADMTARAIWHPYHVLSRLRSVTGLGGRFEVEIQLSRLIHLGLRVHDRGLDGTVHNQCDPVNPRLQSLRSITDFWICLNCPDLFAIPRLKSNIRAFNRFAFSIFDKPLNGCLSVTYNFVRSQSGFRCAITHLCSDRRWRRRSGRASRNFVCSETGFGCAIANTGSDCILRCDVRGNFACSQSGFWWALTPTDIQSPLWRRSDHVR